MIELFGDHEDPQVQLSVARVLARKGALLTRLIRIDEALEASTPYWCAPARATSVSCRSWRRR
jgi:hypothetical protein